MKILRAIGVGALLWVLIFFEVSVLMFALELEPGTIYYLLHYFLLALFAILCSMIYFRKAKSGFGSGLLLGLIMIIIGILLDAIFTVPLFVKTYTFFIDVYLWIGLLETIVLAGIVGAAAK